MKYRIFENQNTIVADDISTKEEAVDEAKRLHQISPMKYHEIYRIPDEGVGIGIAQWKPGDDAETQIPMNTIELWQTRQRRMDEWHLKPENEGCDMKECTLISDYEYLDGDVTDNTAKFICTWIETREKVYLEVAQVGQGVPYYRVVDFATGKEMNDMIIIIGRDKVMRAMKILDGVVVLSADTGGFMVARGSDPEALKEVRALGFGVEECW